MSHTPSRPAAEPVSERDAAWFEELTGAVARGRTGLLARQRPDGHWVGELEGDTILESEFILLLAFLGKLDDPRITPAANYLRKHQQPGGGWSNYTDGPAEISVSVKAYFALKIAGDSADEPHMKRAAAVVRALGGAEASNSFTRFYLALLGQVPYSACPSVPAEIILLPRWFYFNVYALSAWSRTIFVPLSVVDAYKPVTQLPERLCVRELFLAPPEAPRWPAKPTKEWFSWTNFFLGVDYCFKALEHWGLTPLRRRAVRTAVNWMRERYADSDGVGAIFPPMVYNAIVLKCLGVPDSDPEMRWALKQIDDLCIYEGDTLRLQPCLSPVWDTALSLIGAADAGLPGRAPECEGAVRWLLDKEVRRAGDWSKTVRGVEPGGWFFEYRNGFYPDTDDTSMVLIALARGDHATREACAGPIHRAVSWLLAMQNRDGGWAAFDRDIDKQILERVPFADHNAMLDPSCPDITARVLEALSHYGFRVGQAPVDAAVRFVLARQEESGAWFGRWGVNYIYGTWQVLVGLQAIGFDMTRPVVRRAVRWLKDVQNEDGGWGESCTSYDDPTTAGRGTSTASQTAWALLGLLAAGEGAGPEVRAGAEFLVGTQHADGGWTEGPFTGTGFPRVFYLKYHMYPVYFPLMALARYASAVGRRPAGDTTRADAGHSVVGPKGIARSTLADR
ncbi:squalene--hopene cyclase [Frigoriglobus tundricola]|uniref:Squalene--hopene cyclase n=1 Tax=Frigoriglobus tundricola TaxID=2774151 RepID=A0A6M5Z1H6_9BACT|nr:squalene--hopene cyclase [Frigoriglobus tundricola]QJW99032.1 Squalene--hopene cyclase [Frigoriglobus tundricola]